METILLAISVLIPILICALLGASCYICCSKKYRLNWFEQSILDLDKDDKLSPSEHDHIVGHVKSGPSRHTIEKIKYAPLEATPSSSSLSTIPSAIGSVKSLGPMAPLHTDQMFSQEKRNSTSSNGTATTSECPLTPASPPVNYRPFCTPGAGPAPAAVPYISTEVVMPQPSFNKARCRALSLSPGLSRLQEDYPGEWRMV